MGVERAEAADKLQIGMTGEFGRVHGVEVVEHGTIGDARIEAADGILRSSCCLALQNTSAPKPRL